MLKFLFQLLLFLFLAIPKNSIAQAPSIQWSKCLGGSSNDEGNFIQPTTDGGYIMIGTESFGDGDVSGSGTPRDGVNFWVVKMNSLGAIQ